MAMSRAGEGSEAGFSLLELMIVIGLLGVVMAAVLGGFIGLQNATSSNVVRQQTIEQAEQAMQNVSKDIRATADNQATDTPLILTMTATSIEMDANIDTLDNNAASGNASAYGGCPDQITISGSATPGPITETRTHPNNAAGAAACTWNSSVDTYTRTLVTGATLNLSYFTLADPTTDSPAQTSTSADTTASVQVVIAVSPSNGSSQVTPAYLEQMVPLAAFTSWQTNSNSNG
jgi:prepilin-type N-terminal cleavage/methylation domain-containing protein